MEFEQVKQLIKDNWQDGEYLREIIEDEGSVCIVNNINIKNVEVIQEYYSGGRTHHIILEIENKFYKILGWYDSWNGTTFEVDKMHEVSKKEETVVVTTWEPIE